MGEMGKQLIHKFQAKNLTLMKSILGKITTWKFS